MSASIDQLQIDVTAQVVKANDVIDKLVGKLERISTSRYSLKSVQARSKGC